MIINLLRVRPRVFLQQIYNFKERCEKKQKTKTLMFHSEDVDQAVELLVSTLPTHPLVMSPELCELCKKASKRKTQVLNQNSRKLPALNRYDSNNHDKKSGMVNLDASIITWSEDRIEEATTQEYLTDFNMNTPKGMADSNPFEMTSK